MSDSPALKEIAKALKEISGHLKEQNRILKESHRVSPDPDVEPVVVPPLSDPDAPKPRTLGWSTAALYQREGTLIIGDTKNEQDDSQWLWNGEAWERIELPSGG